MKLLINALIVLAALAFVAGFLGRILNTTIVWEPLVHWRGAMGFLAFAMALTLIQIRDK